MGVQVGTVPCQQSAGASCQEALVASSNALGTPVPTGVEEAPHPTMLDVWGSGPGYRLYRHHVHRIYLTGLPNAVLFGPAARGCSS